MKVKCPICERLFKEINNSHLSNHNLTVSEYDKLYPDFPRMSIEQRKKKARYQKMTPEISKKLKRSHTLDGYKEKYGEDEGLKKFKNRNINMRFSKTLDNFIRLYGEQAGTEKYKEYKKINENKMKLSNFIRKYGKEEGTKKYLKMKKIMSESNTKEYYIKRYGYKEGNKKWNLKNLRNSRSSMKIPTNQKDNFELYKMIVNRFTKKTLKSCDIANIELIEKGKYSLDHKFSILEGFKNNIPPYIIASKYNVEVIPHNVNCSKQDNCSITLIDLLTNFY